MIQPLRTAHRAVFLALALFLPVLFVSGLLSRHKWPPAPTQNARQSVTSGGLISQQTVMPNGKKIDIRIFVNKTIQNAPEIQLIPASPLVAPDILVYWSETEPKSGLSANARLLGAFTPTQRYRLPAEAGGHARGYVVLYSLAQKQLLASFSVESRP